MYSRVVMGLPAPHRTPTPGLFLGLVITLAAVVAYSAYITRQISRLRDLQNNLVDRNRKDSLQLLAHPERFEFLALAMRDMLDNDEPYPLTAWSAQFQRIRADLDDALRHERASGRDGPHPRAGAVSREFGGAILGCGGSHICARARTANQTEARTQIRLSLHARQEALSTAVSRLLVQNNESEEQAARGSRRFTTGCSGRYISS